MYIVSIKAKQKNGRRHVMSKEKTLEEARKIAQNANDKYIVEIYNGKWELIETVK